MKNIDIYFDNMITSISGVDSPRVNFQFNFHTLSCLEMEHYGELKLKLESLLKQCFNDIKEFDQSI